MIHRFPMRLFAPDAGGSPAAPAAGGAAQPGAGVPPAPGTGAPPASAATASAASRPEWLPEEHWDPAGGIKPEFGAHYGELATFHKAETERQAALKARKPEDIKIALPAEFKLPDGLKGPDGKPVAVKDIQINEKDPRIPLVRAFAQEFGLPQEAVSKLVALDAQMQIEAYNAETARLAEENKQLGEKAGDRLKAVDTWAQGLKAKGEIGDAELAAVHSIATTAAGVTLLEKLIAKASGSIPGHIPVRQPAGAKPGDIPGYDDMTFEQRRAAQWARGASRTA